MLRRYGQAMKGHPKSSQVQLFICCLARVLALTLYIVTSYPPPRLLLQCTSIRPSSSLRRNHISICSKESLALATKCAPNKLCVLNFDSLAERNCGRASPGLTVAITQSKV
ncbi:hypothetical protein Y032_0133g1763 [Ancylostoma ceylanicum]|uniref:Uncharacterized protein n=1 Tax=Ancylostoma ceylanicum TaxID=53326 RepID=A0A016T5G0_9BILA|nr:hypothetical protein Y032_0133g1763 [Ancylostoma ceylanicum]